jgi:hypothetical protein
MQHNVRLSLTYLDLERGEASPSAAKAQAMLKKALQPVPSASPAT